jgi:hypothetical protein
MQVVKIVAGTCFVSEPPMNGHVLFVNLADQRFVALPQKPFDVVALANIRQKKDQRSVCLIGDVPIRGPSVVCDLDSHGPVVV